MNKILIFLCTALSLTIMISCGTSSNDNQPSASNKSQTASNHDTINANSLPLNISIVLDLSDRLIQPNVTPSQFYNDTAIINYFVEYFIDHSKKQRADKCTNRFQILFYPTPSQANINNLSKDLCIDLGKLPHKEKRVQLLEMKSKIDETLDVIYSKTLSDKKWVGSDIWDFFTNKQVDKLCIRPGYRNIVAILTDGYLYHANHKIKEGNSYSYVLSQTLKDGGKLISRRNDLKDLEVIMLEVNPKTPNERDQLVEVLHNWFINMGVKPNNLSINETQVASWTETIIENFLNH